MIGHEPGARVLVVAGGDPYTGRVGTVANTWHDDEGERVYTVQFCAERGYPLGDHHTAYYLPTRWSRHEAAHQTRAGWPPVRGAEYVPASGTAPEPATR